VIAAGMLMPTMTGEELLRIVKKGYPQIIRILVTCSSDVVRILRAFNEGLVARYVGKPWIRTEMVQALRWAIEEWTFSRGSAALYRHLLHAELPAKLVSLIDMQVADFSQLLIGGLLINVERLSGLAKAA